MRFAITAVAVAVAHAVALIALPAPAAAINNGTLDGDGHPAVGAMLVPVEIEPGVSEMVPGCGGALIAPRLFLTASHCVRGPDGVTVAPDAIAVTFQPDGRSSAGRVAVESILVHPQADPSRWAFINDVAVIVLAEPQAATPYRLPGSLVLDALDLRGVSFELVGYGATANPQGTGRPTVQFLDQRQVATAPFQSLTQTFLNLLENTRQTDEGGACYSDSGSPVLLPGQQVVYAVTTGGNAICRSTAQKQRLDVPAVHDWLLEVLTRHAAGRLDLANR